MTILKYFSAKIFRREIGTSLIFVENIENRPFFSNVVIIQFSTGTEIAVYASTRVSVWRVVDNLFCGEPQYLPGGGNARFFPARGVNFPSAYAQARAVIFSRANVTDSTAEKCNSDRTVGTDYRRVGGLTRRAVKPSEQVCFAFVAATTVQYQFSRRQTNFRYAYDRTVGIAVISHCCSYE